MFYLPARMGLQSGQLEGLAHALAEGAASKPAGAAPEGQVLLGRQASVERYILRNEAQPPPRLRAVAADVRNP